MTKFDPPPLFQPCVRKNVDPPPSSLDPPPAKNLDPHLHFDNSITAWGFLVLKVTCLPIYMYNLLYCIVLSLYIYIALLAVHSAHPSEAFPVRETQREGSSLERTKRGT